MKVNILDAHDRLEHFTKHNQDIDECCQNLIDSEPFDVMCVDVQSYYIFAHARTDDDGVTKRLIWQPRLTKPEAQPNSMLFKVYKSNNDVHIKWIIPAPELWPSFNKGKMTENQLVFEFIDQFKKDKKSLEHKETDDLSDQAINKVYKEISEKAKALKSSAKKISALPVAP